MNDTDIKSMLRAAGVPREAFSTTLAKAGHMYAREWAMANAEEAMAYVAYDSRHATQGRAVEAYNAAELLFYLIAKELALLGHSVFCCDLLDLHSIWVRQEADDTLYQRVADAEILCIRNIYEAGSPSLPVYDQHIIASRLVGRHRDGTGYVFLGDTIATLNEWWPLSFVSYLTKKATILRDKQ